MYIHVVTYINYITGVASLLGDLLSHVQFMNIGQQARRQNFSEGGSFDTAGDPVWGPFKAPRNPWVFGAKSCNLAISTTFGKPCFPLIFIKFYTN